MMNPTYREAAPPPSRLKSCLRQGNFSRGMIGVSAGRGATVTTQHSSAIPSQAELLKEYRSQQQYQQQQYQQHPSQQQQQSREEEESSVRSSSSAPTMSPSVRSATSGRSASSAPTIRSAPSTASSATTVTRRGNGRYSDRRENSSVQSSSVDDDEREFMRISRLLVTEHTNQSTNSPLQSATLAQKLLHAHMPSFEQRQSFYNSLRRNVAYLPMFPEPNEHPSLAMTRYVEKMFGPVLAREVRDGIPSGNGIASNEIMSTSTPRSYGMQRYPQHYFNRQQSQCVDHPAFADTRQPRQIDGRSHQAQSRHYDYPVSPDNRQPQPMRYKVDDVMFPPPPMVPQTLLREPNWADPISTINHNIPPPIPISQPSSYHPPQSTQNLNSGMDEKANHQSKFFPTNLPTPSNLPTPLASNTSIPRTPQLSHQSYQQTPLALNNPSILKAPLHHHLAHQQQHNVTFAKSPETVPQLPVPEQNTQPLQQQQSMFMPATITTHQHQQPPQPQLPLQELRQPEHYRVGVPSDSPLPRPLSFSSTSNNRMLVNENGYLATHDISTLPLVTSFNSKSLIGNSTDDSSLLDGDSGLSNSEGHNGNFSQIVGGKSSAAQGAVTESASIFCQNQYQTFSNKDMLPPLKPLEDILYYPHIGQSTEGSEGADPLAEGPLSPSCCDGVCGDPADPLNVPREKRPPTFMQLYIKCERSEPFINKDLDIVTWYCNDDNKVTADRTLVVRNTVTLVELIKGVVESFGLSTKKDDDKRDDTKLGPEYHTDEEESSSSLLGCYHNICFVSDVKTTKSQETAQTRLTPLPIPGLYYKYVERSNPTDSDRSSDTKKSGKSTALSTDPFGLQRTIVGQVLDKPVYASHSSASVPKNQQYLEEEREGIRNRLALVYCTPKRQATVSSRSMHHGTLPETIYHFQILLEGIVAEDDLPSSFVGQTAMRCVGATGGVLGGSVIDSQEEIDQLNRSLWKDYGPRDVVGLVAPAANERDNLEQILYLMAVPLFDIVGNQTPKEFVVDRCLYNIYSGKVSMEVARKTQHTMEAIEGTTEWLARRVEDMAKNITEGAKACDTALEESLLNDAIDDRLDEFDRVVSKIPLKWK